MDVVRIDQAPVGGIFDEREVPRIAQIIPEVVLVVVNGGPLQPDRRRRSPPSPPSRSVIFRIGAARFRGLRVALVEEVLEPFRACMEAARLAHARAPAARGAGVRGSSGYRSGRRSWRETPVTLSIWSTRSAGTLTVHFWTA